jgi:hypothetical protein
MNDTTWASKNFVTRLMVLGLGRLGNEGDRQTSCRIYVSLSTDDGNS